MLDRQNTRPFFVGEEFLGRRAAVDASDAARQQVRKGVHVARTNFQVTEGEPECLEQRTQRAGFTSGKPAAQRCHALSQLNRLCLVKPGHFGARVIHPRVQFRRMVSGPSRLKSGRIVERKAKDREPVGKTIAGQNAQREQLMEAGTERGVTQGVVEIGRDSEKRVTGKTDARLPGYLGEGEAARRKDCANRAGRVGLWGRHGPLSARRKMPRAGEKEELTVFADKACVRYPRQSQIVTKRKQPIC